MSGPWGLIPGLLDLALSGWKVLLEKPPVLAERQEARPREQKATSQLRGPGQGPSFLAQGCPDSPSACARHGPGAFHTHRALQGCCLAPSSSSANRGPSQCKGGGTRAPVPCAGSSSGRGQHGGQQTGAGAGPGEAALQELLRPHSFAGSPPESGRVWTLVWVGPPGASATLKPLSEKPRRASHSAGSPLVRVCGPRAQPAPHGQPGPVSLGLLCSDALPHPASCAQGGCSGAAPHSVLGLCGPPPPPRPCPVPWAPPWGLLRGARPGQRGREGPPYCILTSL